MSSDKAVNLQRRQAMRRRGFVWEQTASLSRIDESGSRLHAGSSREDRRSKGSSLDLTPTLLGIYDQIASANQDKEQGPVSQSENKDWTNVDSRSHSDISTSLGIHSAAVPSDGHEGYQSETGRKPVVRADWEPEHNDNRLKMEAVSGKVIADNENDNKKRPLSISSMSSSSTSSLPRHRKRPNLCEYSTDSGSSVQLDIEKIDNIQYIDDTPSTTNTDDDISVGPETKRRSDGDSDSQHSADPVSFHSNHATSFHRSDSNLSYPPSDSTSTSATDLSVTVDQSETNSTSERSLSDGRATPSPSRSSQKSPGLISRSGSSSLKQGTHYVSYVQRVVSEIVDTERIYVKHLQDIQVGYYQYLVDSLSHCITRFERDLLFGNILEIFDFSCHFLSELEVCGLDPVKVAECFVRNNAGFVIYAEYCTNYPSAVAVLTRVMHDPQLSEVFKQRQLAMGHSLPLGSYLLKPVQRILKYHLLLQNILKHYSQTDPGHQVLASALDHMTGMAQHINEMKRKHEHAVRVQEIQSQLEDYEGEDFTQLGELVLEGSFRMYGAKASRQMFLFNKGVIIAKRKEDGMLSCKIFIPCATLMLVESIAKEPLNFQILPFDNPRGAHTIHARNLDQKRKWCQEIKRLILESFSRKIPDKVKEMVILQLGKSKEEDDYAQVGHRDADPGKSHVTTPEYLERRQKLRRKSGGTTLIPEILKPQRAKKYQLARKGDTSSPKLELKSLRTSPEKELKRDSHDLAYRGYRSGPPSSVSMSTLPRYTGPRSQNLEEYDNNVHRSKQSPVAKRPVSIQRSQSFQLSTSRRPPSVADPVEDVTLTENVSQDDGHPLRSRSFRLATRVSPIRLDTTEEQAPVKPADGVTAMEVGGVLKERHDNTAVSPATRRLLNDHKLSSNSYKDVMSLKDNQENVCYTDSFRKRGRYASMPVLTSESSASPKLSRLSSESSSHSPTINHNSIPKSSVAHTKQIDMKPFFSWNKDRFSKASSPGVSEEGNLSQNLSRTTKPVTAFHDMFSGIRKSSENLAGKTAPQKTLVLTQPKPFSSSLTQSTSSLTSSQARLNRWGKGKHFTKGSLADLSHVQEDPWVKNKQVKTPSPVESKPPSGKENSTSQRGTGKQHQRTQSFDGDDRRFSKDNLDWLVYANRNSIPVSGFPVEDENLHYKYCTPPRGSMEPPGADGKPATAAGLPRASPQDRAGPRGSQNTDSSVSLSATTSSDTCSSPDILKDSVFEYTSPTEQPFPRSRGQLSRSFSTPDAKRSIKYSRPVPSDRPVSSDVFTDVSQLEASAKLVEEMERYMKRSSSSSSSLSSNKFPTSIPTFEPDRHKHKHREPNKNRDSCISSNSASSYESASLDDPEEQGNGGNLVGSIKNKLQTITSKLTGKKSGSSDLHLQAVVYEDSAVASPATSRPIEQPSKPILLNHNLSLRIKGDHEKSPEPDLPSLLRESEPGSRVIGSRMANPDFDDYATFSLSRSPPNNRDSFGRDVKDGQSLETNASGYTKNSQTVPVPNVWTESLGSKQYKTEPLVKNLNVQQSDSAFSIQSVDIDSSTPEDSPRDGNDTETVKPGTTAGEHPDTFYERRLSADLNVDDAFRDSAVYCDADVDSQVSSGLHPGEVKDSVPKVPIKEYVQKLEEKTKLRSRSPVKVKQREPGVIIRQRMESLQANAEFRRSSSNSRSQSLANSRSPSQSTSRGTSRATSRGTSRATSRASSEEKQLTCTALKEYIDQKFPMAPGRETEDGVFRSRSNTPPSGKLTPAFSLGGLDQLSTDVDNLVIMKGWVRQLIGKFQAEN